MQLPDPRLTGMLDRRVEENNLVLYPNLVYDGLERQVIVPVIPNSFLPSPLSISCHSAAGIVFCPVELRTPDLYSSRQAR